MIITFNQLNQQYELTNNLINKKSDSINDKKIIETITNIKETNLTHQKNQTETEDLQENLKKFKIKTNEMESGISIINKAYELITTKNQFKSFNMNNIEDRLNKLAPTITSQLKDTLSNKPKL